MSTHTMTDTIHKRCGTNYVEDADDANAAGEEDEAQEVDE